jgi:hypothetical protein
MDRACVLRTSNEFARTIIRFREIEKCKQLFKLDGVPFYESAATSWRPAAPFVSAKVMLLVLVGHVLYSIDGVSPTFGEYLRWVPRPASLRAYRHLNNSGQQGCGPQPSGLFH